MNRYYRSGIFTLALIGGYYLWRNRFEVQRFLESKGISTPLDRTSGRLTDTIRSGVAKVTGKTEHAVSEADRGAREAV